MAVLAAAAVAVGALRDPLAGIDHPRPASERGRAHGFDVERIATGLNRPTWVGVAPGDPQALWVLEQPGRVVRMHRGRRTTVIDLTGRTTTGRGAAVGGSSIGSRACRPRSPGSTSMARSTFRAPRRRSSAMR